MASLTVAVEILGKDGLSGPTRTATASLTGLDQAAAKSGNSLGNLAGSVAKLAGGAALGGITAIAGGFAVATKSAADFQKQVSGIAAVGGPEAVARLDEISAKALQVGKDTAFSATEAAAGMEELIKAGVSLENVLGPATDATVALAAATGVDLATAAGIAANAMNQFHLEGAQVTEVADIIAGAANASAIDIGQFGLSLQSVGAVANLVGLSFKDTAVAIAEMGQAGIPASDAGTSLKTMLMSLQPATKKASEEFQKLGLITRNDAAVMAAATEQGLDLSGSIDDVAQRLYSSVTGWKVGTKVTEAQGKAWDAAQDELGLLSNAFFTAEGKAKPLVEIQAVLADATKDLTEQQKLASLEILFGSDAIRAAAVLADNGAEGFEKMADAMGKVSAADVAKTRLDNLNGSMDALGGSLNTVAITVGMAFLPALKDMVDGAIGVISQNMPLITQFSADLPGAMRTASDFMTNTLLPTLGDLATALGPPLRETLTWLFTTGFPTAGRAAQRMGELITGSTTELGKLNTAAAEKGIYTDLDSAWKDLGTTAGSLGKILGLELATGALDATTKLELQAGVIDGMLGPVKTMTEGIRDLASIMSWLAEQCSAVVAQEGGLLNFFQRIGGPLGSIATVIRAVNSATGGGGTSAAPTVEEVVPESIPTPSRDDWRGPGGGGVPLTAGNPGQFGIGILSANDAAAACGPYAALLFANTVGRYPTSEEALELARKVGWTPGEGMGGMTNFVRLLGELGISGSTDYTPTVGEIRDALRAGSPVALSTARHYFAATGIGEDDRLDVGGTGSIFAGGSAHMTLEEIDAIGGGLQGVITLSQQFGEAINVAAQRARLGLSGVATAATEIGAGIPTAMAAGMTSTMPVVVGAATVVNGQLISALAPPVQAAGAIGQQIPAAMAGGIRDGTGEVVDSISNLTRRALNAFDRGDFQGVRDIFNLTAPPVQQHATGGVAAYTGLHWLEQGERVLTVRQSSGAGAGGGGTIVVNMPNFMGPMSMVVDAIESGLQVKKSRNGRLAFEGR